ncbi:long-chain fatty acid transport protein 4 [Bradysia coprophila]|uniref:long-chain fatty acid transport protein 4 n=1 Tax=Bradysia coprophila TaxID=38358 RepID=UPI00187DC1A6|nr:long-chain fatty acid transport protein 4 [Bradysia coprophila]
MKFSDVDIEKNATADEYRHTNTNKTISCTNNNNSNSNNNNHTSFQLNDDYNFTLPTKKDSKQAETVKSRKSVACRVSVVLVSCFLVIFTLSTVTLVWYYMGWIYGVQAIVVAIIAVLGASGIWRLFGHWLYIAAVTGPRDVRALLRYLKLVVLVKRYQRKNVTIGDVFVNLVTKHPNKICFVFEDREWTFNEVNEFSNRIAHHFHSKGFKAGDIVGLFMENRPEFVCIWLGLSKIGVIVPLINTNLRLASLLHSITVANCNALIFGSSLTSAVDEITLPSSVGLYQFNDKPNETVKENALDLLAVMKSASADNIVNRDNQTRHHNKLLYIYTSGTTGLPKAAVISHSRFIFIAAGIHYVAAFSDDDVFYTPLPLYHTAGGVMSIGQALLFGSTVVIRKKFSASGYFSDCQKYNCTVSQYIGEMCRYILATPQSSTDKGHKIRTIFGNGLRPQIWKPFVDRFNIPNVAEFYGATEGNANIVNIDNKVGAIGFVSRILPSVYPISIIRADQNTGEPIRGPDGLCQLCRPNEPGVFIGKIIPNNPSRAFLGYVDEKASSKKVVRDVFKKGDSAFLSGDVLVSDERGYLFFIDRTGDTFRWKGENVSTSEVEAQVSNVAGYRDCVVYGVEIPNLEGRAGMAAILDAEKTVDLTDLADGLKKVLPSYARPQFIRLLTKVDMTGTFKLKKLDLQKQGFDPSAIDDKLYYLTSKGTYSILDRNVYEQINRGELRF